MFHKGIEIRRDAHEMEEERPLIAVWCACLPTGEDVERRLW